MLLNIKDAICVRIYKGPGREGVPLSADQAGRAMSQMGTSELRTERWGGISHLRTLRKCGPFTHMEELA